MENENKEKQPGLKQWIKPTVEIISKDKILVGSLVTVPEGVVTPGTVFTGSGS